MGLLSKIFGSKKDVSNVDIDNKAKSSVKNVPRNENCIKLMEFASHMEKLLAEDRYIARSDYKKYIDEYQKIISFFEVLSDSGMLGNFCDVNGVEEKDIVQAIDYYNNAETYVEDHNEEFLARAMVEEKEYLDNVLKAVDPVVVLDEDQRKVVLTDEDYCLVIAGAGAGKTTTVAAKVKYLVDKKGIDPAQILVVSFTNKAVNELKEKIQDDLGVPCPIATFHSTGNAIIHKNSPEEKLNIVDNSKLYFVIRDYFRGSVMKNESVVNKLIMFFATYFDAPYEGDDLNGFFNNIAKANYSTMRSDLEDFKREVIDTRTKKSVTIQNEILRSHQEVEIANFLYLNNIEYEYEPIYQYNIQYSHKPYTPDFVIYQNGKIAYIEHFGITENGKNDRYSQDELEQYKKAINDAVETALTQLIMYKKQEGRLPGTILLLGRYAFDGDHLEKSGLFEFVRGGSKIKSVKYPKLDITFMTAHSSKGLGYDDVIIVNGKNETYGFPSKIEDDPVLAFVIKGDRSIDYAEERRLFYVAMTRTKNRVFFVAPEQNPSEFLLELKKDYKNVVLHGNWNEEKPQSIAKKSCPLCGYPMQLKYKRAYGLRLYICTNEPEICGFMTNDYRAGKLCIQKCDKCRDGYLVVKSSKENGYFLGCTNYKTNGTGCNKSIGMKYYYDQMGYQMEIVTESPIAISRMEKENPVKRVAVTPVSTDDYVEIEKTTAASVRYKRWILNNVVDTVLRALQDVSKVRYYGVTMLTDILRGANSKRILDNGLEMVPEYGMLKEIPRETIQNIIEWLINEHYILKTKEKYPILHSTYEGLHYSESLTETKLEELKAYLEKDEL